MGGLPGGRWASLCSWLSLPLLSVIVPQCPFQPDFLVLVVMAVEKGTLAIPYKVECVC